MPFGRLDYPSLGLTQIQSVLGSDLGNRVQTVLLYLNHDFANRVGLKYYIMLTGNTVYPKPRNLMKGNAILKRDKVRNSLYKDATFDGMGDWIFRKEAFPHAEDNVEEYFTQYLIAAPEIQKDILAVRSQLSQYLDDMIDKYDLTSYDILGFTSMNQQQMANMALMNRIKALNPGVFIFTGGCNMDGEAAHTFSRHYPNIDVYIQGPSLEVLPELIENMLLHGIPDPSHRKIKIINGSERAIDRVVDLDYTSFYDSYEKCCCSAKTPPTVFWETSRGCWWGEKQQCTFCDCNRDHIEYRAMTADLAVDYINGILDGAKGRCSYFYAVDAVMPPNYITNVLPRLKVNKKSAIFLEVRATMKEHEMEALKKARVVTVQCGIEALDNSTLKILKKGTTSVQNIFFLKSAGCNGIAVLWNLLAGIPGELVERYIWLFRRLSMLYHLFPPTGMWSISYDRTSTYVKKSGEYGLQLEPKIDLLKYLYPFDNCSLKNLAYFYNNRNIRDILTDSKLKYIVKINYLITKWRQLWMQSNEDTLPRLYLQKNQVIDSREGVVRKIDLLEDENQILRFLMKPRKGGAILERFPSAHVVLDQLSEKRLIWEDGDWYISLATTERPQYPCNVDKIDCWV